MTRAWTTPSDIAARVRRRWNDGSLLRAVAAGDDFEPIEVPITGPTAAQIGDDMAAARDWKAALEERSLGGRRYTLTSRSVGGRHLGRNEIPGRAVIASPDQAWELLKVRAAVDTFRELVQMSASDAPVQGWVATNPLKALDIADAMPALLAAYRWLDSSRGSSRYLREISAEGVDTKFAEKHRTVLAAMLGVPSPMPGFLAGLGLSAKPELVRIRPSPLLGLPQPLTELAVRIDELAALPLSPKRALVIENEVTYLSVDVPSSGVVIWGKGFEVDRVGRLPWLVDVPVAYWGDIDTHGFAILNRLRAWLPQTESVLMDRATLLEHRDRWVVEPAPASAALTRLTSAESELYADLVRDHLAPKLRLEQERIDWKWGQRALRSAGICGA